MEWALHRFILHKIIITLQHNALEALVEPFAVLLHDGQLTLFGMTAFRGGSAVPWQVISNGL